MAEFRAFSPPRLNGQNVALILSPQRESPSTCSPKGLISQKVRVTGFEPAALWTQTTRSTKLSYTLLPHHSRANPSHGTGFPEPQDLPAPRPTLPISPGWILPPPDDFPCPDFLCSLPQRASPARSCGPRWRQETQLVALSHWRSSSRPAHGCQRSTSSRAWGSGSPQAAD